jgi:hypothetical protein
VDVELLVSQGFALFLMCFSMFVAGAFFFQRFRWRCRKRRGRPPGFYPTSTSMGNALQQLQATMEPQMKYVLEEKLDEEADEDDSGGPDDPTRHLLRQARKLQRGEKLERLTYLFDKNR